LKAVYAMKDTIYYIFRFNHACCGLTTFFGVTNAASRQKVTAPLFSAAPLKIHAKVPAPEAWGGRPDPPQFHRHLLDDIKPKVIN
jgi:hypothetical protein